MIKTVLISVKLFQEYFGIYLNTFSLDFPWICKDLQAKP